MLPVLPPRIIPQNRNLTPREHLEVVEPHPPSV
jgi:hypothetical protein